MTHQASMPSAKFNECKHWHYSQLEVGSEILATPHPAVAEALGDLTRVP